MTRGCIAELYLQGIVILILAQLLQTVGLTGDVGIVGHHLIVKLRLLVAGEGRGLRGQRVQQNGSRQFIVVIIGEGHGDLSKAETIELLHTTHPTNHRAVAISQEGGNCLLFAMRPVIVVLHNHQQVARTKLVLTSQHHIANTLVVDVRPFVRAGDDHRLVHACATVARGQLLNQLIAGNHVDIAETLKPHLGQLACAIIHQTSHLGGIPQNTRLLTLT